MFSLLDIFTEVYLGNDFLLSNIQSRRYISLELKFIFSLVAGHVTYDCFRTWYEH